MLRHRFVSDPKRNFPGAETKWTVFILGAQRPSKQIRIPSAGGLRFRLHTGWWRMPPDPPYRGCDCGTGLSNRLSPTYFDQLASPADYGTCNQIDYSSPNPSGNSPLKNTFSTSSWSSSKSINASNCTASSSLTAVSVLGKRTNSTSDTEIPWLSNS